MINYATKSKPIKFDNKNAPKYESTNDTNGEAVQLAIAANLDQLLILDTTSEHDSQNGPHDWRHKHAGYQDHT